MVENLNSPVIYCIILTIRIEATTVNYGGIFITLAPDLNANSNESPTNLANRLRHMLKRRL